MTAEQINEIALELIAMEVSELYEFMDDKSENARIATLGEIRGISLLAEKLIQECKNGQS